MWVRGDAAFATAKDVHAALDAGAWFSFTVPAWPTVTRAIAAISEGAWTPIRYPRAILDETTGEWVSEAEVAETTITMFTSHRKAEPVTCRLVVQRVKRLGIPGQDELVTAWRHHAFITNTTLDAVQADAYHRGHAIIEQVIAELKAGPLAHLPSGKFAANAAWLACAVIAFNIARAAAVAAGMTKIRMATLLHTLINVPARLATTGRRTRLHLPSSWPWQARRTDLWNTATGPPAAA